MVRAFLYVGKGIEVQFYFRLCSICCVYPPVYPPVGPVLMCLVGPIYFNGATIFINASEKHINIGVK